MKQSSMSERPVVSNAFFIGLWNGLWLSLPLWGIILVAVGFIVKQT